MSKLKYFTQEELKKLFWAIKSSKSKYALRDYCIFRIAYRCALRASEIGLLKLSYYNSQQGELYCQRLKNSQNNTIRLDDETKRALNKYIREYEPKSTLFYEPGTKAYFPADVGFVNQEVLSEGRNCRQK